MEIYELRKHIFSEGNGGILPHGYKNWNNVQLKRLKSGNIEFLTFLNCGSEVKRSKSFASYLDGLKIGLNVFFNFNINRNQGDILNKPDK